MLDVDENGKLITVRQEGRPVGTIKLHRIGAAGLAARRLSDHRPASGRVRWARSGRRCLQLHGALLHAPLIAEEDAACGAAMAAI